MSNIIKFPATEFNNRIFIMEEFANANYSTSNLIKDICFNTFGMEYISFANYDTGAEIFYQFNIVNEQKYLEFLLKY